ncbi:zinc transport protein [Fusarium austroafricanum]|uniref:Zinc transport protein n=1 Tax=Fusarium austroafricanum TaxID=2364996 RepID=A0A8H4KB83_9HYPO|nr:zinc transport protein [Fusarium austroafricanum]
MDALPPCFVNEVTEPVKVLNTGPRRPEEESRTAEVHQFSTLDQIRSYFGRKEGHEHPWILIFLAGTFNLNSSVWDVSSCFYSKDIDIESTFCIPLTLSQNGSVTELSYTIRYPEFKPAQGTWVIRQTGIYQKFDTKSCENISILFNPVPRSNLYQNAEIALSQGPQYINMDFFWIHKELFNTYFSAWRLYNVHLEKTLLPIANNAVSSFIEELSETEYHHLPKLAYLEGRLVQIPFMLAASKDVLEGLSSLCHNLDYSSDEHLQESARAAMMQFDRQQRYCEVYSRVAECLQQQAQKITQLLANTLSFREQSLAKAQNTAMLRLNKSAVFITTLTLLYLPPSFVATFFGMNFFDLDDGSDRIVVTSMIWIYILCSAVLTIGTFVLYHFLLDRTLFGKVAAKVLMPKTFVKRIARKTSSDTGFGIV